MSGASMRIIRKLPPVPRPATKAAYKKPVIEIPDGLIVREVPYKWPEPPKKKPTVKEPIVKEKRCRQKYGEYVKWTPEMREKLASLYNAGKATSEISREMNIEASRVMSQISDMLRKGNLQKKARKDIWTETDDATLISRYNAGDSFQEISWALGRTKGACWARVSTLVEKGKLERREK